MATLDDLYDLLLRLEAAKKAALERLSNMITDYDKEFCLACHRRLGELQGIVNHRIKKVKEDSTQDIFK